VIIPISWEEIHFIWQQYLWPNRISAIEPTSAMHRLGGYDIKNMESVPVFLGYISNNKIVGVNSGHACPNDLTYRSRGLWVDPLFRGQGIGQSLLAAVVKQGQSEGYNTVWSYPRQTSWTTYQSVGFSLISDWETSENSDANAYCMATF